MSINPISFGSLQVFTLESGKPKPPVPDLIKLAFRKNPELNGTAAPKGLNGILKSFFGKSATKYNIVDGVDTFEKEETAHDGTVNEAFLQFGIELDELYKDRFPSEDIVYLTKAKFTKSPKETETRYFLTASNYGQESEIHKILNKGDAGLYSVSYSKSIY